MNPIPTILQVIMQAVSTKKNLPNFGRFFLII